MTTKKKIIPTLFAPTVFSQNVWTQKLPELIHPKTNLIFLHNAIHFKRLDIVKYLIENNLISDNDLTIATTIYANPNRKQLPIYRAVRNSLEIVNYLLENTKIDVNKRNLGYEDTVLHVACIAKDLEMVKLLIEKGKADSNDNTRPNFETPMWRVISDGNIELVRYLVEFGGANLKHRNHHGDLPINQSVQTPNLEIFKYLCKQGGLDLKTRNAGDESILYIVCCFGELEMLKHLSEVLGMEKFLIEIKQEKIRGKKFVDIVTETNQIEIVKYLQQILK